MPSLTHDIGFTFEEMIAPWVPDLTRLHGPERSGNDPDFLGGHLGLEAKVGQLDTGIAPKSNQLSAFSRLGIPVVYACGLHNYHDSQRRIGHLNSAQRRSTLKRSLGVPHIYWMSNSTIRKIWFKEHRMAKKNDRVYCIAKARHFEQIIHNNKIVRGGLTYRARPYYNIRTIDMLFASPQHEFDGIRHGWILDTRKDETIIDYLQDKGILPPSL